MDSLVDRIAPCRQDRSYDKEVITQLFSYRPYIGLIIDARPWYTGLYENSRV